MNATDFFKHHPASWNQICTGTEKGNNSDIEADAAEQMKAPLSGIERMTVLSWNNPCRVYQAVSIFVTVFLHHYGKTQQ